MHIIIGLAGLWATLVSTRSHMPNGFTGFFHPAALILLLGAPPSILLVGHDVREIWRGVVTLAQALRYNARRAESRMIADLYRFGRELKQGRTVEASKVLAEAEDPLLREVGPLLLQPGGGADARETVLTLSYARLSQVKEAEEVFRFLARTTPAVGLMGTIVGLVNMLINLKNFEQLGPAMAVAQLATFYGLILAYAIWSPFAKRIENYGRNLSVSARLLERGPHQHRRGAVALRPAPAGRIGRGRPLRRGGRVIGLETGAGAGGGAKRSAKASPSRSPDANDLLAYGEEDDTSWLIPYVDVVSLLLAFLILALAMSKVNLRKFEMVSAAISHQAPPPSLDALKEKIDAVIASQGLSTAGEDRPRRRGAAHGAEERAAVRQRPGRHHADRARGDR